MWHKTSLIHGSKMQERFGGGRQAVASLERRLTLADTPFVPLDWNLLSDVQSELVQIRHPSYAYR